MASSPRQLKTEKRKGLQAVPGEVENQEKFLHWKDCQALEQTGQGCGGVTITGSIQEILNMASSAVAS